MRSLLQFSLGTVGLLLAVWLVFGAVNFVKAMDGEKNIPDQPQLVGKGNKIAGKGSNGNDETPGEWYAGETPENILPDSPVLLFVHGLNSKAQVWWEENDMYDTAYQAGYETAFIQLYDAGGESADMWDNGNLLAEKIEEVSDHFNGKEITIVAHSKGGVDSQTALSHSGASEYVDNVITLGSPHHGSQLADLAYSNWAGWLGELLGMKGDGTESMQMGYMEDFRSETDEHPLAYENNYYTMGGTSWGSVFSANWFGGVYLSSYGDNDGVVTAESSQLPGGEEIAVGAWDHSEIRTGTTFSEFETYLSSNLLQKDYSFLNKESAKRMNPDGTKFIRGGDLQADDLEKVRIPIEDHNQEVTISLLTAHDLSDVELIDPAGKKVSPKISKGMSDDGYFSGATHYELTIPEPVAGEWILELQTKVDKDSAYLVTAHYDSTIDVNVLKEKGVDHVTYHFSSDELKPETMNVTYRIIPNNNKEQSQTYTISGQQSLSQNIHLSKQTLNNITIDIEGVTKSGHNFKRTIVDSVYTK